MKFETNYVFPAGKIFPLLIWASLSVCAISLGITLAMLISTSRLSAEVDVLEDRLSRYRSHEIHKPESLLSQSRLVELRTKVRALNELTGATRQSLPQLLSQIEKLLIRSGYLNCSIELGRMTRDSLRSPRVQSN